MSAVDSSIRARISIFNRQDSMPSASENQWLQAAFDANAATGVCNSQSKLLADHELATFPFALLFFIADWFEKTGIM